jgi:hypothetical protein
MLPVPVLAPPCVLDAVELEELALGACILALDPARLRTGELIGDEADSRSGVWTDDTDIRRLLLLLKTMSASSRACPCLELGPAEILLWVRVEARESRAGNGVRLRIWIEEMRRRQTYSTTYNA